MLKLPKIGKLITTFTYTINKNNNVVDVIITFNSQVKNIILNTDTTHPNINSIYDYVDNVLSMALTTKTVHISEFKQRSYVDFTVKGLNNTMNNRFSGRVN